MKIELRYFLTIIAIFTLSVLSLFTLLKKYSFLTFEHFLEVCRQVSSDFLASGLHHVGFGLSVLATFSMFIFFTKSVFSYIKTKRRLNVLLSNQKKTKPQKVLRILKNNRIEGKRLVVVQSDKDIAITIDWLSPRIVISTGLIKKLKSKELESVILHEYYHAKLKHPLLLVVSEITTSALFFIPVLRDLNKKLRSVLEEEADKFTKLIQKESDSIELALSRVKVESDYSVFPSFSARKEYKFKSINLVLSIAVVLVGLGLYVFPTQTHASQDDFISPTESCVEGRQCSVHCDSENMSKEEVITTNIQHKIIMSSYQSSF